MGAWTTSSYGQEDALHPLMNTAWSTTSDEHVWATSFNEPTASSDEQQYRLRSLMDKRKVGNLHY